MCRKVYIKPLAHELLKDLESEIKKIVGADVCSFTEGHPKYDAKYEKIKELLNVRQTLLNELFFEPLIENNLSIMIFSKNLFLN